ncbi:MAG: oxidoreductase domain protein, partial [Paenibacillaceae bacterium]|nr:oxidoreductase domain protein [Paenibacillaceae bacterium]
KERNDCQLVAMWDEQPDRGRKISEQLQVPFYDNLGELLTRSEADAVIVTAPSSMHEEVIMACAEAGKSIFTEKVLALTAAGADRIIDAVQRNGVKLTVSLPRLCENKVRFAKQAIDQGLLGNVTLVRTRLAHDGALEREGKPGGWLPEHFYDKETCGGGAMIDLGCHPMYLAHHFLGLPSKVSAQYGYVTCREVEDNAVVTLGYADGAIAVVEAGFASRHSPFTIEIYGTHGSLLIGNRIEIRTSKLDMDGCSGWITPERIPDNLPKLFDQWVDDILHSKPALPTVEPARALSALMEAANKSASEGRAIAL